MSPDQRDRDQALLSRSARATEAAELASVERAPVSQLQAAMGCPAPVWLNTAGSKQQDGICVVYAGSARCAATASRWVWIGCTIGEHLDKSAVCRKHAEDIARRGDTYNCKRCWDAIGRVSEARVIKIEDMRDDDNDAETAPGAHPDLLP